MVEVTRLDLGMRKRQAHTREQLALSIRTVNNMVRTLRKSNSSSNNQHRDTNNSGDNNAAAAATAENNGNQEDLLPFEPLDQQALKAEIAAAEVSRATNYAACRKLRRTGAVFAARRERLESTLAFLTGRVRGTLLSLERIMGQLRKHLALARVQERVFHEEVVKAERMGLKTRRRLEVVREQLSTLGVHPHKVEVFDRAWLFLFGSNATTIHTTRPNCMNWTTILLGIDVETVFGGQKEQLGGSGGATAGGRCDCWCDDIDGSTSQMRRLSCLASFYISEREGLSM